MKSPGGMRMEYIETGCKPDMVAVFLVLLMCSVVLFPDNDCSKVVSFRTELYGEDEL